jgi:hypothetical protein
MRGIWRWTTVLVLWLGLAATAQAAPSVRVQSPQEGAVATRGVVHVVLRVRESTERPGVFLTGKRGFTDVSARFRRTGPGRWAAALDGRDLGAGRNHLYARMPARAATAQTDAVGFTWARRRTRMVRLGGAREGGRRAPVTVRVRLARHVTDFRARLNDRVVSGAFGGDGRVRVAQLAAHHGLRFGRNRLRILAFDRTGRFQRISRTFRIAGDRPLVSAGRDRHAPRGRELRLDGSATRASRRASAVDLRWEIVAAPDGARPRFTRARTAHPRLVTDAPGHYTIRLHASDRAYAARAAQAPVVNDTVVVVARPDAPPRGVPIETVVSSTHPGVQVGDTFYAQGGGWLQLVVLDRQTLASSTSLPAANVSYPGNAAGVTSLKADVAKLKPADMAILSAGGPPAQISGESLGDLVDIFTGLGGTVAPASGTQGQGRGLPDVHWSLIGSPGMPEGMAYQFVGLRRADGATEGAMAGFLQLDHTNRYTFTWPPAFADVTFDTQSAETTAAQNVMAVGDARFPMFPTKPDGTAFSGTGYQLVWLDADTLDYRGSFTFDAATLYQLADKLWEIGAYQTPGVIFLGSIGTPLYPLPSGSIDDYDETSSNGLVGAAASALSAFGANELSFIGQRAGYAFVGVTGLRGRQGPNAGAEANPSVSGGGSPRIAGLLRRSRQGLWTPASAGSPATGDDPGQLQPGISEVLAQPDQPFTPFSSAAQAAAEQYIIDSIWSSTPRPATVRELYWENVSVTWDDMHSRLTDLPACTDDPCAGGYAAVRAELLKEFPVVDQVRQYFSGGSDSLSAIIQGAYADSTLGFVAAQASLNTLLTLPKAGSAHGPDPLGILGGVLGIATGIGGLAPGGEEIGAGFEVVGGIAEIVQAVSDHSAEGVEFGPTGFDAELVGFAAALSDRWDDSLYGLDHTADLLVSDAGRLEAAYQRILDSGDGGWGFDSDGVATLRQSLQRGLTQYIWYSLLPSVEATYECADEDMQGRNLPGTLRTPIAYLDPPTSQWTLPRTNVVLGKRQWGWPQGPPAKVTDLLFGDPAAGSGNIGFEKAYLFDPALTDAGGNPTSAGLLRLERNQKDENEEYAHGLHPQDDAYRPACGHY